MTPEKLVRYVVEDHLYNNAIVSMLIELGVWGHVYADSQASIKPKTMTEKLIVDEVFSSFNGTEIEGIIRRFDPRYVSVSGDLVSSIVNEIVDSHYNGSISSPHTLDVYVTDPNVVLSGPLEFQTPDTIFDTMPLSISRHSNSHIQYEFFGKYGLKVLGKVVDSYVKVTVRVVGPGYKRGVEFVGGTIMSVTRNRLFITDPISAILPISLKSMTIKELGTMSGGCNSDSDKECGIGCFHTKSRLTKLLIAEHSPMNVNRYDSCQIRTTCYGMSPIQQPGINRRSHRQLHQPSDMCIISMMDSKTHRYNLPAEDEHMGRYVLMRQNKVYRYYVDCNGNLHPQMYKLYERMSAIVNVVNSCEY